MIYASYGLTVQHIKVPFWPTASVDHNAYPIPALGPCPSMSSYVTTPLNAFKILQLHLPLSSFRL